jgi:hypothetical protein
VTLLVFCYLSIPAKFEDALLSYLFYNLFVVLFFSLPLIVLNGVRWISLKRKAERNIAIKRFKLWAEICGIFSLVGLAYVLHGTYVDFDENRMGGYSEYSISENTIDMVNERIDSCYSPCRPKAEQFSKSIWPNFVISDAGYLNRDGYLICVLFNNQKCLDIKRDVPTIKTSKPKDFLPYEWFPAADRKTIKYLIKISTYTAIFLFVCIAILLKVIVAFYEYIQEIGGSGCILFFYRYSIKFRNSYIFLKFWRLSSEQRTS